MIFLNNWLIYGKITLRDFVCCRQRTFGLPPSICKLSRLGVRLEMHVSTKSQIRHIMSGLSETRHHLLHDRVVALATSRWMMPVNDNAIIQIELMHHDNQALLSSTLARDGSGPLKASFLTMLLLEDTIAHAQSPFGICSGAATVTLHRFIDIEMITNDQLALAIANFARLNDIIFADYLSPPFAEPLADKRYSI